MRAGQRQRRGFINHPLVKHFDNPAVTPRINTVCQGVVRPYGETRTPLSRARACADVSTATKEWLRREVERQFKVIEANRRPAEA